jgi:hypothetical protein
MKSLEKIIQALIVNGSLTEQPGLFYGKTGIAVFSFTMHGKQATTCFRIMLWV